MTGIAKKVGGRLDKDKYGNILGTISGLEKVQTQHVVNRFRDGFVEFYSYNRSVHPGINLERPEPNDTAWYHVTVLSLEKVSGWPRRLGANHNPL